MDKKFDQNWENSHSKENLMKMLESEDRNDVASAEALLGVCKYPKDYWIMPDHYYPGIGYKVSKTLSSPDDPERAKARLDDTSNGRVITSQLFSVRSKREYKKCKPKEDSDNLYNINIREDEIIEVMNEKDEIVNIPWSVFCGIFLKARELGYSRPDALDYAGPFEKSAKEKWLKNQEKIKELQEKID